MSKPIDPAPEVHLLISTGEVSGDLQGALLIKALQQQAALLGISLKLSALGGERMQRAGATLLADTSAIGSIGLFESLPYIWATRRIQRRVQQHLRQHPPDLVVMIDYFAPNLSLGRFLRQQFPKTPTVYYIAPQEWVWSLSPRNTQQILSITDRLLAIFPAEASYYQQHGAQVSWVGHPLLDRVQAAPSRAEARVSLGIAPDAQVVALIPASRQQELRYILPVMLAAARQIQTELPQVQFWLPVSLERYWQPIQQALRQAGLSATLVPIYRPNAASSHAVSQIVNSQIASSQTVIAAADLVLAKSGTVNLETALLNVPQVVMYRVNPLTAWIAEHLLKFSAPFVAPPNLVMMQPIVPEFLQQQAQPEAVAAAAVELLQQPQRRLQMQQQYQQMRQHLGEPGVCLRAASAILELLQTVAPEATAPETADLSH
ncbi:MAG: lipid-A-disaccharide synthase [Pegethrix bostrychoides GSE-TBD4-15B]|uniref:Lipid-A-disaccharide synthase n=1 Tax=Pegethrix bostrychoides GSE-TBD4-15B TaxID=2839662 RepID=A0A951P762_9CYAN|nr:lipid-A-disaccharide synthase [Pegethrix bostrychoides GSE-TBD4-15B]